MKDFILLLVFSAFCFQLQAQVSTDTRYQQGYFKKDGTYVQGHFKSEPNITNHDNLSTKPNTNYFTGEKGTRAGDYTPEAKNYGENRVIYTGEKGGQYYYNDKGNKVYVPKQ